MTDINTIIRTLRQAEEVHKVLEGMKRHQRTSTGPRLQGRGSNTPECRHDQVE